MFECPNGLRGSVVVVVLAMALAGCARDGEPAAPVAEGADFATQASLAIENASQSEASDQQIAILERAAESGVLSFEDAKVATMNALECMSSRGLDATYEETELPNGLAIPGYSASAKKSDGSSAVNEVDLCDKEEMTWVNRLYQLQPTSVEQNLVFIERQAPIIRQCLEDAGYATDPGASAMDIVVQSGEVARETEGTVDCAGDAGVVTY